MDSSPTKTGVSARILAGDPDVTVAMLKEFLAGCRVPVRGRVTKDRLYRVAARVARENSEWLVA